MHAMTHDEAVNVYCAAIDATVIGDAAWWRDVRASRDRASFDS